MRPNLRKGLPMSVDVIQDAVGASSFHLRSSTKAVTSRVNNNPSPRKDHVVARKWSVFASIDDYVRSAMDMSKMSQLAPEAG
jgi:hypothetical protein